MPLPELLAALRTAEIPFERNVPLSRRTWWRAGGPADAMATIRSVEALSSVQQLARRAGVPITVLGNASNLLVSDAGIRGLVITLDGTLAAIEDIGSRQLELGAGAKLVVVLARARRHGWTGLECFAGIPGTVGGAIRMNAGSSLGETSAPLVSVEVVRSDGSVETYDKGALQLSYRTCVLPDDAIISRARFATTDADADASDEIVREFLEKRKATQPLDLPSCGSTFRNPPGDAAGRLLEQAGLKGFSIGGAEVSPKHANFVVNNGGATAADIRGVILHMQRTVEERFGVRLAPEVHFVGEWPDGWAESR
jgi:UDP-N-acetylmuramate dehydrogenase